ncbi:MAG: hypothetical protein U7123_03720 [Potamolinea sp.]
MTTDNLSPKPALSSGGDGGEYYQLPLTNYPLPITPYQLPITNYPLPITPYQLPLTYFQDRSE